MSVNETNIEKLNTHIKGLTAQVQAHKDMLNEMISNATVMRTNQILLSQAYKELSDKLDLKNSEVKRLQDTIASLKEPVIQDLCQQDTLSQQ